MSIRQVVHIFLSIPFYHSTISFQFINTCEENNREFVLLPQKILNKLSPNLVDIHRELLIEKYKTRNESLNHISLAKFVANFGIKSSKKSNIIKLYVGFHLIFIKIQNFIIKNYCFHLCLFMD